jgi:L-rhamnose-H+ transport protein
MTSALGLVILGGVLAALFIVPTTTTPRWKWENIWGLGSLVALVAVPWPLAWATVPHLADVYREAGFWPVALAFFFGVGWGLGGIFWGQAIVMLGLGLGTSIMVGLVNVFGSPVPLAMNEPAKLLSPGGQLLLVAMAVLISGVGICAYAGKRRDRERLAAPSDSAVKSPRVSFGVAMLFCLLAGALSAMNNFGPIFGQRIVLSASAAGATELGKMNAMWAPLFTANYLINAGYALYLMVRRGTLRLIVTQGSWGYFAQAVLMGIAWPMCLVVYGMGVNRMGAYGAYTAYPMFLGAMILTGNLVGILRGEWRSTSTVTRALMVVGILVLAAAFLILGQANQWLGA